MSRNAIKIALAAAAVALTATAGAQTKTASSVRIYINAGHGSWGPDDRPMPTIPYPNLPSTGRPDTCGFYESNTNLWKCLKLGETLEKMGVRHSNIMYSRKQNGPYPYVAGAADAAKYNRSLSEISAEVDANNMDVFISIHSNAAAEGTTTNYPLFLYRGKDGSGGDYAKGSRDLCNALWAPHFMDEIEPQSAFSPTSTNIRGDIDFYHYSWTNGKGYTGYLGVLMHSVPGTLVEGFFHTYQPARHRALNKDYCGQEGVRVARGLCDYLGLSPEKTGYIMGTVKDMHEKIVHTLFTYAPGTNDQWLPLNGAKVILKKGGEKVGEYQVDKLYNGIFVFEGLEPGDDYTFEVEAEGYKPLEGEYTQPVTVRANETTYAKLLVESSTYTPPVAQNYPTPVQETYLGLPSEFKFSRTNRVFSQLKGTLKRAVMHGDTAVVLAENNGKPELHLINLKRSTYVRALSTAGILERDSQNAGDYSALSDIAFTADGQLVGINSQLCQYSDAQVDDGYKRGTVRLYKWATLAADPQLWATTQSSANFYRATMGRTLAVSGEARDCSVITTATTTGSSRASRMLLLSIVNNQVAGSVFTEKTINADANFTEAKQGANAQLAVSPLADDRFVIDGGQSLPQEFAPAKMSNNDSEITGTLREDSAHSVGVAARGANYFRYGKRAVMVTPYASGTRVGGLRLYDITGGFASAEPLDANATVGGTSTFADTTLLASGASVDGKNLTLYLFIGNRLSKYTTSGTTQPTVRGIYAFNLGAESDGEGNCKFSFSANSKPVEAYIVFYDRESGEAADSVRVGSPKLGLNTVSVPFADIPGADGGPVSWAVRLRGQRVYDIQRLNSTNSYSGKTFCAVDNSPESPYFGRVYVANNVGSGDASNGLYAYTPMLVRINSRPYTGGQTLGGAYRLSVGDGGHVYIADNSSATGGVYIADPANLAGTFSQFFAGTRASNGTFRNGAVRVGSKTPCVSIAGGKAYVYLSTFSNNTGVYDIGTGDSRVMQWSKAPSSTIPVGSLELNGDGQIVPDSSGGVWVSQVRFLNNNTSNVPSLIYANAAGKVVFNSGSADFADKLNGSCGAGFAVSRDGRLLVINDASGVLQFYDVAWVGGVPSLTPKYTYIADVRNTSDRNSVYQMAFDYGGNLVCAGSTLGVYSLPTDRNESIVPAPRASAIVNAIHAPTVEGEGGGVAYDGDTRTVSTTAGGLTVYDTAGAIVAKSAGATLSLAGLSPGIYIVKTAGGKARKILLK